MVIAALLHNIGQFLPLDDIKGLEISIDVSSVGRIGHEKIGEEYLRRLGFSESIYRLVGSHVAAKRSQSPPFVYHSYRSSHLLPLCKLRQLLDTLLP